MEEMMKRMTAVEEENLALKDKLQVVERIQTEQNECVCTRIPELMKQIEGLDVEVKERNVQLLEEQKAVREKLLMLEEGEVATLGEGLSALQVKVNAHGERLSGK